MISKKITIALLVLAICATYALANDCKANPALQPLKDLLAATGDDAPGQSEKDKKDLQTLIEGYENITPAAVSDGNLGNCKKVFATQPANTCCSANLVESFKKLVKSKYTKRRGDRQPVYGLLRGLHKALVKCTGKKDEDIPKWGEKEDPDFGEFLTAIDKGQRSVAKSQMQLTRGQLCGLCISSEDFATYFSDGKLKVEATNFGEYTDASGTGLLTAGENWTKFKDAVLNVIKELDTDSKCTAVKDFVTAFFDDPVIRPCDTKENCKQLVKDYQEKPFGDGPSKKFQGSTAEPTFSGKPEQPPRPTRGSQKPDRLRNLADETIGSFVIGDSGIKAYQVEAEDDKIDTATEYAAPASSSATVMTSLLALTSAVIFALLF